MAHSAREIMDPVPRTVTPDTEVRTLAALLLAERLDGTCVVDEAGALVGVVTTMDLVFQERPVHLPSFFALLDAFVPTESGRSVERDIQRISGARVADIMSTDIETVSPDTPVREVATRMVDHHHTLLPVVDGGRLVGVVDKRCMLKVALGRA
jgi:CBS domain-containing protein